MPIFTYSLQLKKSGESGIKLIQIESEKSLLEDVVTLMEQQQKKGNIPYGYHLLSISCVDVQEGSMKSKDN